MRGAQTATTVANYDVFGTLVQERPVPFAPGQVGVPIAVPLPYIGSPPTPEVVPLPYIGPATVPVVNYDLPPGQKPPTMLEGMFPSPGTYMGMQVGTGGAVVEERPNLIAGRTKGDAKQLVEILGLDENRWKTMGIGDPLTGYHFGRALVLHPDTGSLSHLEVALEWISYLRTKADKVVVL